MHIDVSYQDVLLFLIFLLTTYKFKRPVYLVEMKINQNEVIKHRVYLGDTVTQQKPTFVQREEWRTILYSQGDT